MESLLNSLQELVQTQQLLNIGRALLLVLAGLVIGKLISRFLARATRKVLDPHRLMLLERASFYSIVVLFSLTALTQLGFDLGVLLGTAGIVTVALAFAAQTSMSNFISGLFLIAENPFEVGDLIQLGGTVGEVLEIDVLSVKLRKFDNTFVRLPNELLIKSEFATLTKYPIRRVDLPIRVAYEEDLGQVRDMLVKIADVNPLCMEEPRPLVIFQGFGDSAQEIQFSVWALGENFLAVKNGLGEEIKRAFDEAGIDIPFPQRTVHLHSDSSTASGSMPF
jgi:small-conductance mechanosensitive channel